MKKIKKNMKVYDVTIQKILNKKITMNALNEEEARTKAEEFMNDVEIEFLNPVEAYSFEIEKISDNEDDYLKEKNLDRDYFHQDFFSDCDEEIEEDDEEEYEEKEYFVMIIIDDLKIFKAHGKTKFEAMSKMIDIAILNDLVTPFEKNDGYVFINAELNIEDIKMDFEEFSNSYKSNKSLNMEKLNKQFKEEIERLSE